MDDLTKREREILSLIAQGLSTSQIADQLVVSPGTVKAHSHNIYSKLGVGNRTQALIRAGELGLLADGGDSENGAVQPAPQTLRGSAPVLLTPFFGRRRELDQLRAFLHDARVRLVTILGAGGMGKTRLAVELAARSADTYADGVVYVALARLSDAGHLASAIIDDMGLRFLNDEAPESQLVNHLRDKNLLLVLDNCEHVLEGITFVSELLQKAPGVTIVATSRERLNLSMEVVYVLGGLDHAVEANMGDPVHGSAIELMLEQARRIKPGYTPHAADWTAMQRICRMTAGMPLALILAVGWLDLLSMEEIADELAQGLDILESQLRDLPARQRSMRSTIMASWQRLTPAQQRIYAGLALFRGGFDRDAAQQVAGAGLRDLQVLVNRSLLTVDGGRYELHELLRQFAESELVKNTEEWQRLRDLHCAHYTDFLHARLERLLAAETPDVIAEITVDLGNLRVAWRYAVEHGKLGALARAVQPLMAIFHTQSRFQEAIETCETALRTLRAHPACEERTLLLAILTDELGFFYLRPGRLEESEALFWESHQLFQHLGYQPAVSFTEPRIGLSLIASIRGDYQTAGALAEEALQAGMAGGHLTNQAYALYALASIRLTQGAVEQARAHAQRGAQLAEQARDRWLLSHCLCELGHATAMLGDYAAAAQFYQACYAIREVYDDRQGMATILTHLGDIELRRDAPAEATRLFEDAQTIYTQIHDRGGLATVQHRLAQIAFARGDDRACRQLLRQALETARQIQYVSLIFGVLLMVAELRLRVGRVAEAGALLEFIAGHESCGQQTKDQALKLLATQQALDTGADHHPVESLDLAEVVAAAQVELTL